jgi:hypothetical protein
MTLLAAGLSGATIYLPNTVPTREVEGYVPPKVIAW